MDDSEARGLLDLLAAAGGDGGGTAATRETASAITLKAQSLAEHLLTRRHYVDGGTYDPRFLLFEFTHNMILRKAQVPSSVRVETYRCRHCRRRHCSILRCH